MGIRKSKAKSKKLSSINRGRPPLAKEQATNLSSKATRTLIRSHHNLQKAQKQALKDGEDARARDLEAEIVAKGGLMKYQLASRQGQCAERGGDSSRVLVKWLKPVFEKTQGNAQRLRLLEIGALSTKNACSGISCLDVKRIDLKSREPGIKEVDFMDMAVPEDGNKFHIISLSLVLNYVPDPASRGAMIARIPTFLEHSKAEQIIPALFLVLPLACVANSRYLTEERLSRIMRAVGFQLSRQKTTSKLYYSLWTFNATSMSRGHYEFKKEELRSGASRNNFAITMSSKNRD
jgi:25S rRNA (adenine2142-N1)-methyltransferase